MQFDLFDQGSDSQQAWQRQLSNGARYAAKRFLRSQGVEV